MPLEMKFYPGQSAPAVITLLDGAKFSSQVLSYTVAGVLVASVSWDSPDSSRGEVRGFSFIPWGDIKIITQMLDNAIELEWKNGI